MHYLYQDNEDETSDGSHELDKVILVQPVKQDAKERESEGERSGEVATEHEDKKGDEVKIVLTGPSVQAEEDDLSETVSLDHDEEAIPVPESQIVEGEPKKDESDGERKSETQKNEGIEQKEVEENCHLDELEVAPVQDASSVPVPDSKMETQIFPENKDAAKNMEDEEDTSSKVDKHDTPDGQGVEKPSSQKDRVVNDSKPMQLQEHNSDPTTMVSHLLKPLPNINEGITETKSEPRLPLLPPIGTIKVGALQNNDSMLKSQSATGLISNTATKELPSKPSPTDGQKEGESAPHPLSDPPNVKRKKNTDTLRSTSGSSISKLKKSGASSSAVNLGHKSKSRESLKAGSQTHLSATSRSSENLVDGTTKKLSISRESLKAASQVYSYTLPIKSGESHKKGDSGRMSASKSKGASKDKEGKSSEQKDFREHRDKEEEGSEQKNPTRDEVRAKFSGNTKRVASTEETEDGIPTKESIATNSELDNNIMDLNEKPMLQLSSTDKLPVKLSDALDETDHTEVMTADSSQGTSVKEISQSDGTILPNSKEDKMTEVDKTTRDHTGESSVVREEKREDLKKQEKVEPSDSASVANKEEGNNNQNEEYSPLPPKQATEENNEKPASVSNTTPSSTSDQQRIEAVPMAKDDEQTRLLGERIAELNSDLQLTKGSKEVPTSPVPGEDTVSQTSASGCINKLEIDKKTGQSEQSIVEAVEKTTETSPTVQVITTSA